MSTEHFFMLVVGWTICAASLHYSIKHRHKWHVRAVDHGVIGEPRKNATAILYVCASCGEAKSATLAGTFQIEDVRGPFSARNSQIKSLCWTQSDKLFAKALRVKL